jgi:SAM-dependent methyltransferase
LKDAEHWAPTKFHFQGGVLRASADPASVAVSSRLNVNLLAAALQPLLAQYARGHLLDLGCGSVPLFAAYRSHVADVTCIDWENSGHQLRHIDQACDLNGPLPLEDCSTETVLLTDVMEHIENPATLVMEIARVLAPGGHLIASVPFMYRLHEEPHDYHRYTRHALRRLAESAGLQVIHLEPYGQGLDVVIDNLGKVIIDLHWRWGPRLSAWLQHAALKLRTTRLGARMIRRHSNMPLGYVFVLARA